jgi:hypothetical protein
MSPYSTLNRLPPRQRAQMIDYVTGGRALPKEIAEQIVERTPCLSSSGEFFSFIGVYWARDVDGAGSLGRVIGAVATGDVVSRPADHVGFI